MRARNTVRAAGIALGIFAAGATLAWADVHTVNGTVHEVYIGADAPANSSGGFLVGLALGPMTGQHADPAAMRVPLIHTGNTSDMCVSTRTFDGRYTGIETFTIPSGESGLVAIAPQPPGWQFEKQLSSLPRRNFAAVAVGNSTCATPASTVYVPVVYEGAQDALTVAINAPQIAELSSVTLRLADKTSLTGACDTPSQTMRRQEFNVSCTFNLTKSTVKGDAQLVFDRYDNTGERSDTFAIRFP